MKKTILTLLTITIIAGILSSCGTKKTTELSTGVSTITSSISGIDTTASVTTVIK